MSVPELTSSLRQARERAGFSQSALAESVGVSRQTLIAVEASSQVPSTALALKLARALGCRVEDLFGLARSTEIVAELAAAVGVRSASVRGGGGGGAPAGDRRVKGRVALVRMARGWVAHPLGQSPSVADGIAVQARGATRAVVEPLGELAPLEGNVVVAGCAPLLGPLSARANGSARQGRITWIPCNSELALTMLGDGHVHVAGVHLSGGGRADANAAAIRKRLRGRRMLVVNLTRWRQGLVVAAGNPLGVHGKRDLSRPGMRLVRRERGSGAERLLSRLLGGAQRGAAQSDALVVGDHAAVATFVSAGAADAGVAIEGAAIQAGLDFVPLAEERFDLVLAPETAKLPAVARLLDTLTSAAFLSEARELGGYDCSLAGQVASIAAG